MLDLPVLLRGLHFKNMDQNEMHKNPKFHEIVLELYPDADLTLLPGYEQPANKKRRTSQDREDSKARADKEGSSRPLPTAAASSSTHVTALPDLSRNGWVDKKKQYWACQPNQVVRTAPASNLWLADQLEKLGEGIKAFQPGETGTWKHFMHTRQAKMIRGLDWEITSAEQVRHMKNFGPKCVAKIDELLKTGKLQRLELMESTQKFQSLNQLTMVHGVGSATASEWYTRGITTIDEAVEAGVLNNQQKVGARHWVDLQVRIPREEVTAIVDKVRMALHAALRANGVPEDKLDSAAEARGAGSYRRGKPSSGDVDVLITRVDGGPDSTLIGAIISELQGSLRCGMDHLTHEEEVLGGGLNGAHRTASAHSYRGVIKLPGREHYRRLDLKIYPPEEYAYALLYFTGSDHFNRSMRHYAKARGYSLSDHGIVSSTKQGSNNIVRGTQNLAPATCEADIFEWLGLEYVPPEKRNTDTEVTPNVRPMLGNGKASEAAAPPPPRGSDGYVHQYSFTTTTGELVGCGMEA